MKLRTFKDHTVVSHLVRMTGAKKGEVKVWLYPDGKLVNGFIWLQLPAKAVDKANAKREKGKLEFQTEDCPDLEGLIAGYLEGKARMVVLKRFYYGEDVSPACKTGRRDDDYGWQAEFIVPGQLEPLRANSDYILALEYAGTEYWRLRDHPDSRRWLEGWAGDTMIGAVMPIEGEGRQ